MKRKSTSLFFTPPQANWKPPRLGGVDTETSPCLCNYRAGRVMAVKSLNPVD